MQRATAASKWFGLISRKLSSNLKFTKNHEWISTVEGGKEAVIGITEYAQKSLGDLVYVELPEIDKLVKAGDVIGVVESVKGASDIYSPISGKVIEVNSVLHQKPSLVNKSPQTEGWLCKLQTSDQTQTESLLNETEYKEHCSEEGSSLMYFVDSGSIKLLDSPSEFYQYLLNGIQTASKRIILCSLYIGVQTQLERDLVDELVKRILKDDGVKVHILTDHNRSSRTCADLEAYLKEHHQISALSGGNVEICKFRNRNSIWAPRLCTSKLGEILGVMHMKFMVFDDDVLLTGANLGDSYYTNREDRYLIVQKSPEIANYHANLYQICQRINSPDAKPFIFSELSSHNKIPKHGMRNLRENETAISFYTSNLTSKRVVMRDHLTLLVPNPPEKATMMTAYLSLDRTFLSWLRTLLGPTRLEVITASKQANGFNSGNIFHKAISNFYETTKYQFLRNDSSRPPLVKDNTSKETIFEYNRPGWTFHGKGLQLSHGNTDSIIFGSSNYGTRSASRDVENYVVISANNDSVKTLFCRNVESIKKYCHTLPRDPKTPSLLQTALVKMIKQFL